jgi:hypothetical protein
MFGLKALDKNTVSLKGFLKFGYVFLNSGEVCWDFKVCTRSKMQVNVLFFPPQGVAKIP